MCLLTVTFAWIDRSWIYFGLSPALLPVASLVKRCLKPTCIKHRPPTCTLRTMFNLEYGYIFICFSFLNMSRPLRGEYLFCLFLLVLVTFRNCSYNVNDICLYQYSISYIVIYLIHNNIGYAFQMITLLVPYSSYKNHFISHRQHCTKQRNSGHFSKLWFQKWIITMSVKSLFTSTSRLLLDYYYNYI